MSWNVAAPTRYIPRSCLSAIPRHRWMARLSQGFSNRAKGGSLRGNADVQRCAHLPRLGHGGLVVRHAETQTSVTLRLNGPVSCSRRSAENAFIPSELVLLGSSGGGALLGRSAAVGIQQSPSLGPTTDRDLVAFTSFCFRTSLRTSAGLTFVALQIASDIRRMLGIRIPCSAITRYNGRSCATSGRNLL